MHAAYAFRVIANQAPHAPLLHKCRPETLFWPEGRMKEEKSAMNGTAAIWRGVGGAKLAQINVQKSA